MNQNQRKRRSPLYAMVTAAALSLLLVGPALASDVTTATVTGGSLAITIPVADVFAAKVVIGVAQTTTAPLGVFSVSDLRGTGVGWHVTAQATQFTGVSHNLAVSSLSMSARTVTSPLTLSPDPTGLGGVSTIDAVAAVQIASAALNQGMGIYDFSATTLTLTLPAAVYADTYSSTVTLSAITAP